MTPPRRKTYHNLNSAAHRFEKLDQGNTSSPSLPFFRSFTTPPEHADQSWPLSQVNYSALHTLSKPEFVNFSLGVYLSFLQPFEGISHIEEDLNVIRDAIFDAKLFASVIRSVRDCQNIRRSILRSTCISNLFSHRSLLDVALYTSQSYDLGHIKALTSYRPAKHHLYVYFTHYTRHAFLLHHNHPLQNAA